MGRTRAEPNLDFYIAAGRSIAQARNRLGMTQEVLASKISLTRTSVINIEKGRQQLLLHMLVAISNALEIDPSELIPKSNATETKDLRALLRERGAPAKMRTWMTESVTPKGEDS
jgi:transcriptional regulator with XRE-family HTH domain